MIIKEHYLAITIILPKIHEVGTFLKRSVIIVVFESKYRVNTIDYRNLDNYFSNVTFKIKI